MALSFGHRAPFDNGWALLLVPPSGLYAAASRSPLFRHGANRFGRFRMGRELGWARVLAPRSFVCDINAWCLCPRVFDSSVDIYATQLNTFSVCVLLCWHSIFGFDMAGRLCRLVRVRVRLVLCVGFPCMNRLSGCEAALTLLRWGWDVQLLSVSHSRNCPQMRPRLSKRQYSEQIVGPACRDQHVVSRCGIFVFGVDVARCAWYFVPHMLLQVLAAGLLAQPAPPGSAQPLLYCGSFGGSASPAGAAGNMHVHCCFSVSLCTCGFGRV